MTIFSRLFFHFHFALTILAPSITLLAQTKNPGEKGAEKKYSKVEYSMEVPADAASVIHFTNTSHNLQINTWNEKKVKIIATDNFYTDEDISSSADYFNEADITLKNIAGGVELNSRGNFTSGYGTGYSMESHVFTYTESTDLSKAGAPQANSSGENLFDDEPLKRTSSNKRRLLNVLIPVNCKIDIDSRSSNISIEDDLPAAKIKVSNTNLDCGNIEDLKLTARYSIVNIGDVDVSQMDLENSTLRGLSIGDLDIDSKSSALEYQYGDNITMRSQRDNYMIESVKSVQGRKLYGDLRIDDLYKRLEIEGLNADVKIRNIMPEVELVSLTDKYAELRLPLKNLQNYAINFQGNYSTVFTPFEKEMTKQVKIIEQADPIEKGTSKTNAKSISLVNDARWTSETPAAAGVSGKAVEQTEAEKMPVSFKGTRGDIKGKHTKFEINCSSCTVDFK